MKNTNVSRSLTLFTMANAQESDEKPSTKVKIGLTDDQFVEFMAQAVYNEGKAADS